jgi:ribosome-associated translation inhibitor RaiA
MIDKYIIKFLTAIDKFCDGLAKSLTKKKKKK